MVEKIFEEVQLPGTTDWLNAAGATLLEHTRVGGTVRVDRIVGDLAMVPSATAGEGGVIVVGVGLKRANSADADLYTMLASEALVQDAIRKGQLWYINRVPVQPGQNASHEFNVLTSRELRSGDKVQIGVWWYAYDGVQSENIQMSAHMMAFAEDVK